MSKLQLKHISKNYIQNSKTIHILSDINLSVDKGELICIVGPSGCGKTTLLKIIDGLITCDKGDVIVDGRISQYPGREKGIVFQELALFPWLTALGNVKFSLESLKFPEEQIDGLAQHYLNLVGLKQYEGYFPSQLSGGMNQRVAIARALVFDPEILLLDEPFAALDTFTRSQLQEELLHIWKKTKKTIVFVTHNIEEAIFLGQKVIVMSKNPGTIKTIIPISLPSERNSKIRTMDKFNKQRRLIEELII